LFLFVLLQFKAKGNAALEAGNTTEAIEFYTKAINEDGANFVYYSNRSAAYLKQGDANNALEDAISCVGLNPQFAKGYSRKGAALHGLKRYNDAIAVYNEGLLKFPQDAGLMSGLAQVQKEKDGPQFSTGGGGGGGLFSPAMMAQMQNNPKLAPFLADPAVMAKVKIMQANPNSLPGMMSDPKMMEFLSVMMGGMDGDDPDDVPVRPKKAPEPEHQPEPEEDLSELPAAEREKKENEKASIKAKEKGNALYTAKKFDEAIAAYDEAIVLDPSNMTFHNNKAAVYFAMKKYDDVIEMCDKAMEVGKANMAPFEDRAKALTRCAKAYQKKKDLGMAIEKCKEAQLECFSKDTQRLMKTMELEKKKADSLNYQDDTLAEESKQRGNDAFRNKDFAKAVIEYEDAVKRAPKNAAIRNNLAAALCKIMDFNGAKRQIEEAVELDPLYVKAWTRKGDIEVALKENHKAMDSYRKGLSIEPDNVACKEGLRKVTSSIGSSMTEDERKERAAHAMADPEIQSILQDPVMRQILTDFAENPAHARKAMNDPTVAAKMEKLIASGIVETR
jgi:stress-induced-phosphoprotein 1